MGKSPRYSSRQLFFPFLILLCRSMASTTTNDIDCRLVELAVDYVDHTSSEIFQCEINSLFYDLKGLDGFLQEHKSEIRDGKNWIHIPGAIIDNNAWTITAPLVEGVSISFEEKE
mmetsp:Transcript_23165/g.33843  ORF Transcript_23165/g.33843 Transcript_23165/m.33843 type:complete len:115 (+) Transcript_23165:115-459(+)